MNLSFSFGNPLYLIGLIAPVVLLGWVWNRRGGRIAMPYDDVVGESRRARGSFLAVSLKMAESIPALLLAVAIIMLAGPQRVGAPKSKRKMTNIQFCIDVSGSMTSGFGDGTRYDAAMASINDFLDYRQGDAFALSFFGNAVLHWVPLTNDTSAFRCAPPFMDPKRGALPGWFGGTSIGKALLSCRKELNQREDGDKMIILISDGYSSDLSGGEDMRIANLLREDGIVLYGVHVASGEVPGQVVNIAVQSGGEVFEAGDPAALNTVFRSIDQMQAAKIEKIAGEELDDFRPWAWVGLGLLGLFALFGFFLRVTPW